MIRINISHDLDRLRAELRRLGADIAKGAAKAVNNTAFRVAREAGPELVAGVERPVPFSKRSLVVRKKATAADPTAVVEMKDAQRRYLLPLMTGTRRPLKPSEQKFRGRPIVPGSGVKVDRYGNVPKATMMGVLKALNGKDIGIFRGRTILVRETRRGGGVFARDGKRLVALFIFADATQRRRQIDFDRVVRGKVEAVLAQEAERAIASVLRR